MAADRDTSRLFAPYLPRTAAAAIPRAAPPTDLVFADAMTADAPELARVLAAREGITHAQALQRIARWFEQSPERHCVIVARNDAQLAAYGRAGWIEDESVPHGWYLSGVIVDENHRRRGIGLELTRRRLDWIAARAGEAYYFVNSRNLASIDLHARVGFLEIQRPFEFPGCTFTGGVGVLFRASFAGV